jgi:hypothetical protein
MPETGQIVFSYKEVVKALLKMQDIHDGIWGLFFRFGLGAANVGPTDTELQPAAIIPILQIGLQRMDKESNIAVDAAQVNPETTGRVPASLAGSEG